MTAPLDDRGAPPVAPPLPFARWASLIALLLAEVIALSIRFDKIAGTLPGHRSWWWPDLPWSSFFASSALFEMLRGRWLAGILAGMLYALALYRRRALGDAILAHAVTNA